MIGNWPDIRQMKPDIRPDTGHRKKPDIMCNTNYNIIEKAKVKVYKALPLYKLWTGFFLSTCYQPAFNL